MPFFNGRVNNKQIIVGVVLGLPIDTQSKPRATIDPRHTYKALVDTGATHTCISPKVVESLALSPEGEKLV